MEISVQAFDKICRACLFESASMKCLFTKLEDGQELWTKFAFLSNVQVNREDGLPQQVCDGCAMFLQQANEFRRRCIESDTILKTVLYGHCSEDPFSVKPDIECKDVKIDFCLDKPSYQEPEQLELTGLFSNPNITLKKVDVTTIDDKLKVKLEIDSAIPSKCEETENNKPCELGDQEFEDDVNMYESDYHSDDANDEHITIPIEYKQEKERTYKCACGEEYDSKLNLKDHLKLQKCKYRYKYKKHKKKDRLLKTHIPIQTELACPSCDLTFNSVSDWTEHQEVHEIKQKMLSVAGEMSLFACSQCPRKCKTKKSLTKHIKRHETQEGTHTCPKCKREFKYKGFLDSHIIAVHVIASDCYRCEHCPEKQFITKKSLLIHMESHSKGLKEKKNSCPVCHKKFLMLCTLKDHMRTHTGEKPFLCSICGKGFSQKTNMMQHVKRHMGVKPFTCEFCPKGFVSKGELDAHTRKHSGAHPFICDDCGNGFTTSSALLKHRRIHTGERPYACDLCPRRFAATGTLKNHRRTHTGERPYQCSHCEKSFVQRSDLISHIRCHTGERPFVCQECGQSFRKATGMKAHIKMHARVLENPMNVALDGEMVLNTVQMDRQLNAA